MTDLSPDICRKLRDARRAAKLSQSELAAEVGCKQSAISMFEQGQPTKLNDEVVEKLAKKFGVELKSAKGGDEEEPVAVRVEPAAFPGSGFCPNPRCPSNKGYELDGRRFMLPDRSSADPVGGRYCALCGESLERRCPNCGSTVHAGAICSLCGEPYIVV